MKEDFFINVNNGNGGEQTILIWVPLAILAHNVVLENGGNQSVAHKASLAVVHHGKVINYNQKLSVRRQVIMAARKAADAVIEDLGNGSVAAAVLEAVREGGELLSSANASGVAVDPITASSPIVEANGASSILVSITLNKPLGITFEPIGGPHESGVRIRELPRGGKAYQSGELKVGDELLSINNMRMSSLTYYQVVNLISQGSPQKIFHLTFQRSNTTDMKGRKLTNFMKRSANRNANQQTEQRDDRVSSRAGHVTPPLLPIIPKPNNMSAGRKGILLSEQRGDGKEPIPVNRKGKQLAENRLGLEVKPASIKRSDNRKVHKPAEQRDDGASSNEVKPNSAKISDSRKGNRSAKQSRAPSREVDESPVPASTRHERVEPNDGRMSSQSIDSSESESDYSSIVSEDSSFAFFGFWPSSSQRERSEVSSVAPILWEHPYHPSRLVPGWNNSSLASTSTGTVETSYTTLSRALNQFDLSTLWGGRLDDINGQDPSTREGQSTLADQSSTYTGQSSDTGQSDYSGQSDYTGQSTQEDQSAIGDQSSQEDQTVRDDQSDDSSSWAEDNSSAASVNSNDNVEVALEEVVQPEPSKGRFFKKLRKRFGK